jgi:hypothetical protein
MCYLEYIWLERRKGTIITASMELKQWVLEYCFVKPLLSLRSKDYKQPFDSVVLISIQELR